MSESKVQSLIETAKTGRSKCRKCRSKIEKAELRFGILSFQFDSDGSWMWHHLACGVGVDAEAFNAAVGAFEGEIPNLEELRAAAEEAAKKNRYPRVEAAPSGRAACVSCAEKIAPKGTLRVVIQREAEGPQGNAIMRNSYLHIGCASAFIEGQENLLQTLIEHSSLDEEQIAELRAGLVS